MNHESKILSYGQDQIVIIANETIHVPFQLAEELLVCGANIHPALGHTVGPPVFSIRVGGSNPCLGPRRSKTYWKSGSLRYSNGILGLAAGEPGGSPSSL